MRRGHKFVVSAFVILGLAVAILCAVWDWDWFIPFAQRHASAALGRPVTIRHLHVTPARNPIVEGEGVVIGNPAGFPGDAPPLAAIDVLGITLDGMAWLRNRSVGLLEVNLIHPVIEARALQDGRNNWSFGGTASASQEAAGGGRPTLGAVHIENGHVHAIDPQLKADFALDVATRDPPGDTPPAERQKQSRIIAEARGTYAGQPVTGHFEGGALLAVRSKDNPYPFDLHLENGPSHVDVRGTLLDPAAFGGADIGVDLAGPNLALLTHLVGIGMPETRPYRLTGHLDYEKQRIRFTDIRGRIGRSDIAGSILSNPGAERQQVTADMTSDRVDMDDLIGFLGGNPNAPAPPPSARLLPDTPISLPTLRFADVELKYRGKRLEGHFQPLDNIAADLTIKDGAISLHPLSFGVGRGRIETHVSATPRENELEAHADVAFQQVELARLMAATHAFGGGGVIGGHGEIEGTGNSVAAILGHADGDLKLFMTGGNISAVLVNLSGLDFANSLLSALGLPKRTAVRCMVADLPVQNGVVDLRTMLIDTDEANVTAKGKVNLRTEAIDVRIDTDSKHFSIGSLPGPINIGGKLRDPSIAPSAETAARAGIAVGLGALLTPLAALLPTIQLGLGEDNNCSAVIRSAQRAPNPEDQRAR